MTWVAEADLSTGLLKFVFYRGADHCSFCLILIYYIFSYTFRDLLDVVQMSEAELRDSTKQLPVIEYNGVHSFATFVFLFWIFWASEICFAMNLHIDGVQVTKQNR